MKKSIRLLLIAAMSFLAASAVQGAEYQQHASGLKTIPTKAPAAASAENFIGKVTHQSLFQTTADTTYTGSCVTFAPGARTFWHSHPGGQRLIVVKGVCWTQTEKGEKTAAHAGDTIWCPPDVRHWHGASPDGEMTHLALTEVRNGKNVTWMEPVSDEQYYSK